LLPAIDRAQLDLTARHEVEQQNGSGVSITTARRKPTLPSTIAISRERGAARDGAPHYRSIYLLSKVRACLAFAEAPARSPFLHAAWAWLTRLSAFFSCDAPELGCLSPPERGGRSRPASAGRSRPASGVRSRPASAGRSRPASGAH